MSRVLISNPGLLTTVQDLGRSKLQHLGIPACGAMDYYALKVANILVGNSEDMAVLECTFSGPVLEFMEETMISVTGANVDLKLNGYNIDMYTTIVVQPGDVLDLTRFKSGTRCYIAFAGGILTPKVLESRSTYLPIQFGDQDKKLLANDEIPIKKLDIPKKILKVPDDSKVRFTGINGVQIVNIVAGPQIDYFDEINIKLLSNDVYTLSAQSDRMGIRFEGAKLELANKEPMISDGIPFGAMQITRGGLPIVMMADRQPTGGYPKIAKVSYTDIPLLAQLKPGDKVRFMWQNVSEARQHFLSMEKELENLKAKYSEAVIPTNIYRIYVSGDMYQTSLVERDE